MRVNGNLSGIKDIYIETLDKLYDITVQGEEPVNAEVLDILAQITEQINREISLFINRRGKIVDISVGSHSTVDLKAFDFRRGSRRLSGIRCIHTHPGGNGRLSHVDISALVGLRLDLMIAAGVKEGKITEIYIGHLVPESGVLSENHVITGPYYKETLKDFNTLMQVREIEKNINVDVPESAGQDVSERVFLIGLNTPDGQGSNEDLLDELEELAIASGAEVVGRILQKRNKIDTGYYLGSGKAHELGLIVQSYSIDTVIFDDELSGAQVRNLEDTIGTKVIDRTTLILDIFAKRAMTREGKLQVELAQLKYRLPRLIGLGKVLSRTGGGIGTRGPGEKKLEIDRRHIRERITELENELKEVRRNREVQREKRKTSSIPVVALVGYTNSGKSTLRNRLARMYHPGPSVKKDDVLEADMLFATLDPTTRLVKLPKGHDVLISDTVGFIRKLPHNLVEAFRATLEEVVYSDILVHVVNSSAPNTREQIEAVNNVLSQIGAIDKHVIIALNKVDLISSSDTLSVLRSGLNNTVEISALYGDGVSDLAELLEEKLFGSIKMATFKIPYDKMSVKSILYKESRVLSEDYDESSVILTVEAEDRILEKYNQYIL